jgi:two-component system copper resistance phosphate regulon response regulator CusR
MKILVIEDHKKVAAALRKGLEEEGFAVSTAGTGEEGFFLLSSADFDLVVLDLMLPGRDGMDILSTLRKRGFTKPVLILTARDAIEDRVAGLESGADDYLVKPFAFPELLARIRALLRRGKTEPSTFFTAADVTLDIATRIVLRSGKPIALTAKEFQLLEYFLRNQGTVVSREMLSRDVWHETNRATPLDNVIDVHVARLRRKIDDPFPAKLLHTIRGVGFILREGKEA